MQLSTMWNRNKVLTNTMKLINEYLSTKVAKPIEKEQPKEDDTWFSEPPMSVANAVSKTCKHFYGRLAQEYFAKMDQWHKGTRKENVKNCSDAKLIVYYVICLEFKYNEEIEKLEDEANRRGWSLKKLKGISLNY